ncbi:MAG TPA: hypothetical protein VFV63_12035 [Ilumatobacteraceae bacterium]|nr:hypothetical protein [Ilumatobacteraceae bacterium]
MARPSFRDRFLTPPVARAIMSPLGIVLFGAASAGAILVGAPIAVAAGVGVLAWGGRVFAAVPRAAKRGDRIEPFTLGDPWRSYVVGAQQSKERFDRMVHDMAAGPLKDRLSDLASRLDDGVAESWRIARRGNDISGALARLDTVSAQAELAELRLATGNAIPERSTAKTIEALEAQIASAHRLQQTADDAKSRLRLLDARFDELVARGVEVSIGSGDTDVLGNDVDGLVTELESLRMALEETNAAEGVPGTEGLPGTWPPS